jgi:hypothetical protein
MTKPTLGPSFKANGNDYVIMEYITLGREPMFKNIVAKMAFGVDFKSLFIVLREIHVAATTGESPIAQLNKVSVKSANLMEAIKDVQTNEREPYLELCALFINRLGEDHSYITQQMIDDKIIDWKKEGYDPNDFFLLAINSVSDLKSQWLESRSKVGI